LTGYDAVAHMIEELPNATKEGPKVMICTRKLALDQHTEH